jgi:aryl-alcohol dehydrogenase-like predicted oxidoreductase
MVCIRMTEDDYALKVAQAKELGLTVSGLCERLVLTGKVDAGARPAYRAMDPALFTELRRIGNNVNQIAHAVNGNLPPDTAFAWRTAQLLITQLLSEELLNQKTHSLRTRAQADDSPPPQTRDIFQRSVRVHPARRTDDFP